MDGRRRYELRAGTGGSGPAEEWVVLLRESDVQAFAEAMLSCDMHPVARFPLAPGGYLWLDVPRWAWVTLEPVSA